MDMVKQDAPHCHAPIHPPAPSPTPVAHPAIPLMIMKGSPKVLIGYMMAARVGDMTQPCITPPCIPAGPANIAVGSSKCTIDMMPAARVGDMTAHTSCVAPIPSPTGKILPPCCPQVMIGG